MMRVSLSQRLSVSVIVSVGRVVQLYSAGICEYRTPGLPQHRIDRQRASEVEGGRACVIGVEARVMAHPGENIRPQGVIPRAVFVPGGGKDSRVEQHAHVGGGPEGACAEIDVFFCTDVAGDVQCKNVFARVPHRASRDPAVQRARPVKEAGWRRVERRPRG